MNAPAFCNKQSAGANLKHYLTMNEAAPTVPRTPIEIKLTAADEARFWSKVNKDGPTMPHMETPCWLWTAGKDGKGYGAFKVAGKQLIAHRVSWMITHGLIPGGLYACHRCDNPTCCNPDHLFLGTAGDNAKDRASKGRNNSPSGTNHGTHLHPERVPRGEVHGSAKLTEANVIYILARYAAGGISQSRLAAQFGVTQSLIYCITRRKAWKHLPSPGPTS